MPCYISRGTVQLALCGSFFFKLIGRKGNSELIWRFIKSGKNRTTFKKMLPVCQEHFIFKGYPACINKICFRHTTMKYTSYTGFIVSAIFTV